MEYKTIEGLYIQFATVATKDVQKRVCMHACKDPYAHTNRSKTNQIDF